MGKKRVGRNGLRGRKEMKEGRSEGTQNALYTREKIVNKQIYLIKKRVKCLVLVNVLLL